MKLSKKAFFLFVILVAGCAQSTQVITQPASQLPVALVTPSVVSTIPIVIPSPTIETIPPTNQPTVDVSLENECIPIEDKLPDDVILSGVWVRNQGSPYLENLAEHTKYEIPLKGGGDLITSSSYFYIAPDGKHLAYLDSYLHLDSKVQTNKLILRVINSSGHSLQMDFWKVSWQWIIGWVDNQNLALSVSNSISNNDVIILNPFTGRWKRFEPPQWLKFDDTYYWSLPYNPTLKSYWDSKQKHLILKDVKTGDIIWESDDGGGLPTWSRDGSTLAVVSSDSVDIISKERQLFEFDIRKLGLEPSWNVHLSPDSRKLFFITDSSEKFVFLDTKVSKIYKLCKNDYEWTYVSRPFWSPESRFIVLNVYDAKLYYLFGPSFDLLIDTEQLRAYKLITRQNHERLAWLALP